MRRFVLLTVLFVAGVTAAVWFLRIEEVKVVGARSLSARVVVDASGLEPGQRILWERLSLAERRVEAVPAVADAVAERSLPSTVVLHVIEREPIARLDGARHLAVDTEGVVFPAGERRVEAVLYGWKGKPRPGSRVDAASKVALDAIGRLPSRIGDRTRKIRVGNTLTLVLLGNTEIRFGLMRDLDAKAKVAEAVLVAERGRKLAYIDVRSPSVPVSRERTAETPTPTFRSPAPGASPAPTPAAPASTP